MEARDYFFRLSYQQYLKRGREERAKWEPEVIHSVMKLMEPEKDIYKDKVATFAESMSEIQLKYSNSIQIEYLIKKIMEKESKSHIMQVLQTCWIAFWDFPESKNAQVQTNAFFDGSHLIKINSELIVNISRIVWLYTVMLLLEDITSVADFRDMVSLNTLKNKFLKDIKNDTDEGTAYLRECFLSLDTKKVLNTFVTTFYESALVFIMMHEIGHILELDDQACEALNIISSQSEVSLQEKRMKAEENADLIGHIYSDEYVGESGFFNMGPALVILAISVNRNDIQIQTDHPSIKNRYENVEAKAFDGKNSMDFMHTRNLLYKMNMRLQNEGCWNDEDKNWWMNRIGNI